MASREKPIRESDKINIVTKLPKRNWITKADQRERGLNHKERGVNLRERGVNLKEVVIDSAQNSLSRVKG